ncbi:MAG: hypothetical protein PF961_23695 [Planctomycetota bacterium]|jgi:ribonuclease HII|nr:hypothetical protein [Planctomycetota bacterium]
MIHCTGIDEAGYGPILGPLSIVAASARAESRDELHAVFTRAPTGLRDSKKLHKPGDLGPLEAVAMAAITWFTGFQPETAADVFAVLGETPTDRDLPWMDGADQLQLPCAARHIPDWQLTGLEPAGIQGALIHPRALNDAADSGVNRASCELDAITGMLAQIPLATGSADVLCDRLGGRRYYAEALQDVWPSTQVEILEEAKLCSSYQVSMGQHQAQIAFQVGGESASPLTAAASCVAKFGRELHMRLFNSYWCKRMRTLKACAGYGSDAKRWIFQVGTGTTGAYGPDLIRGYDTQR